MNFSFKNGCGTRKNKVILSFEVAPVSSPNIIIEKKATSTKSYVSRAKIMNFWVGRSK